MAHLDDQEIETLPKPPITTATTATTTSTTTTVNIRTSDSTIIKSLFALAVFLSLALYPNPIPSYTLASDPACAPTVDITVELVVFQFNALTFFIISAITAFSLKNGSGSTHLDVNNIKAKGSTLSFRRRIMLFVSDIGFILGFIFLLSAIVDIAQMKLGTISCGSSYVTLVAVVPLLMGGLLSLMFFIWVYSF